MKIDITPIREWFGYTRRERRASSILLILIVFIVSVRFLFPEKNISIRDIPSDYKDELSVSGINAEYHHQEDEVPHIIRNSGRQEIRKNKTVIVDINRCDTSELIKLPGIGPVLSVRILKYRNLLGGFVRTEQLREVYGLPAETYELIKDRIYVDTLIITAININSADFKTLVRFPYIEKDEVKSILKYRELEGRIKGVSELIDNKLISEEKAEKIRPYLRFE